MARAQTRARRTGRPLALTLSARTTSDCTERHGRRWVGMGDGRTAAAKARRLPGPNARRMRGTRARTYAYSPLTPGTPNSDNDLPMYTSTFHLFSAFPLHNAHTQHTISSHTTHTTNTQIHTCARKHTQKHVRWLITIFRWRDLSDTGESSGLLSRPSASSGSPLRSPASPPGESSTPLSQEIRACDASPL